MADRIHFIGCWPDYEHLFFQQAAQESAQAICVFDPLQNLATQRWWRLLPRIVRNKLQKRAIARYLQQAHGECFVAHEHRLVLQGLLEAGAAQDTTIILRNPLPQGSKTLAVLQHLQQQGVAVFSFDTADCDNYGWQYYRQFIEHLPQVKVTEVEYDFAFVGRRKGREVLLNRLDSQLQSLGFTSQFVLRDDAKHSDNCNLSYLDYLNTQLQAHCFVDIVQAGQQGLTLRPLEALCYGRKLLTTHSAIAQEAFYHPDNIYLWDGESALTDLPAFMARPMQPIAADVQQLYSVNALIEQLQTEHSP